MHDGFDGAFSQEVLRKPSSGTKAQKKPASSCKRPASSSSSMKRPGVKKIYLKSSRDTRVFIADETHLNKCKSNALAKRGRPQSDQVWLRGAILQGHIKTPSFSVFLTILEILSIESLVVIRRYCKILTNLGYKRAISLRMINGRQPFLP